MMEPLLVTVHCVSNDSTYDFLLEPAMLASAAVEQIAGCIMTFERESFRINPDSAELCDMTLKRVMDNGASLLANGIQSGHQLMLV